MCQHAKIARELFIFFWKNALSGPVLWRKMFTTPWENRLRTRNSFEEMQIYVNDVISVWIWPHVCFQWSNFDMQMYEGLALQPMWTRCDWEGDVAPWHANVTIASLATCDLSVWNRYAWDSGWEGCGPLCEDASSHECTEWPLYGLLDVCVSNTCLRTWCASCFSAVMERDVDGDACLTHISRCWTWMHV